MAGARVLEVIGRAERNKREKRKRIIAAARELFRTKGFDQTTTSEIAELADVGKGTLFFHARSKDELLVMVFQENIGLIIDRAFASVPRNSPFIGQAMHVFTAMFGENQRDLELSRIFVKELAFVKGDHHGIDAVTDSFFNRMSALIRQAQESGELKESVDPFLLAYNLFALYYSFLVVWLGSRLPEPDPAKPSLRQMLELQIGGLLEAPSLDSTATRITALVRNPVAGQSAGASVKARDGGALPARGGVRRHRL